MNSQGYPWYDSLWLSAYDRAGTILRAVAPQKLAEFEHAMDVFRTRSDFQVRLFDHVFAQDVMEEIRRAIVALAPSQMEMHEAPAFKRFVVHDLAFFANLQEQVTEMVGEAAGEPVEASYNFLSLYGAQGVCPVHMDAPFAKWTLDLCVNQNQPWPITFGPVVPWPQPGDYGDDWDAEIRKQMQGDQRSFSLMPGQAILFSGSSQWHYRDVMPRGDGPPKFCDLLFFHFIPRGTKELVTPRNWGRLFGVPELEHDAQLLADA
jgi:hypothetical protein